MKYICLLFLIYSFNLAKLSSALSCKDENNRDVDWFIAYKLPKIGNEPSGSPLYKGTAYAYITSSSYEHWKLSNHEVTSENSILGKTWSELKRQEQSATYLFYNDDSPGNFSGSAVGHLKGSLAFDSRSGYWLSHSIPRFGWLESYEYPSSAVTNGQHAFCVSFETSQLSEICAHLLFAHPNIYLKKLTSEVSNLINANARSLFSEKPKFIRSGDLKRRTPLMSKGSLEIVGFVKDNQLAEDLFSNIIAPGLETNLIVESWRRGIGTNLNASCQISYSVTDIISISMPVTTSTSTNKSIFFKSTEDHSKWAISAEPRRNRRRRRNKRRNEHWVCISDMNRMASQERRGGGALCFQNLNVWKLFNDMVSEKAEC